MALVTDYRILLGGSNPASIDPILNALTGIDARVEVVATPQELYRRAVAEPWSLILSCFASPFVGRGRLVAEMRSRGLRTPIFVLTSIGRVEVVVALLSGGVSQVMSLPVSPYRLRRKVLEELHRQKSYHIALQRLILQAPRRRQGVRYS